MDWILVGLVDGSRLKVASADTLVLGSLLSAVEESLVRARLLQKRRTGEVDTSQVTVEADAYSAEATWLGSRSWPTGSVCEGASKDH